MCLHEHISHHEHPSWTDLAVIAQWLAKPGGKMIHMKRALSIHLSDCQRCRIELMEQHDIIALTEKLPVGNEQIQPIQIEWFHIRKFVYRLWFSIGKILKRQ